MTCAHTGTRIDTSSLDRFVVFNLRTKAESRKHQIDHAGILTEITNRTLPKSNIKITSNYLKPYT